MSFQFREPCTRSLRHWSLFKTPLQAIRPVIQGAPIRTLPRHVHTLDKPLTSEATKIKSTKKKAARLWAKYEETYLKSKETLDTKQYDILMTTLLDKATHGSKTGFWSRIIQAYEESKSLNIYTSPTMYLAAIKAYGRSRNKAKVTSIFKEFQKRYLLKSTYYGLYLNALIDCGELTMARRVLQEIQYNPCITRSEVSIYLAGFVAFCVKRKNINLAIQTVESHYGFEWDKEALTNVIQTLLPTPITPLSVESFVSMYIERTEPKLIPSHVFTLFDLLCRQDQFVPTIKTCHLLLNLQAKEGQLRRVKLILSCMQRLEIKPTIETVNILKNIFQLDQQIIDIEDYNDVYKILNSISMKQEENKLKLKGFIERRELETIGLPWIDKRGIDLDGYALILENWMLEGQWNRCIIEFNRLQFDFNINNHLSCVKTKLVSWFASGQDWMYCESELNQYKKLLKSDTSYQIIDTLLKLETKRGQPLVTGQNILKSIQLIEQKLNLQFTAQEISKIIIQLGKRGDIENGYRLYKYVRTLKDKERCVSSSIYRALMESATKNNDMRRLERAWVDMQYRERCHGNGNETKQQHNLTMYNILLNGFASRLPRPDLSLVRKLYQRMLNQKMIPDIVTYNILIKAFVNANNMDAANQIFKKMIESGIEPDTYSTNTLLNGWIIRRDWNHVENFVKELNKTTHKLDIVTFNLLVQSFLQLDSKTMNYTHILKNQNKWKHIDQLHENNQKRDSKKMSPKKIWTIFESTTGYTKESISITNSVSLQPNSNAFIKLFSNSAEPDHITYKLFMKAFDNIGDIKSSQKIHRWMKYRLEKVK